MVVDPTQPLPTQAVKSAQARLRAFDAYYLKTKGGEPDTGEATKRAEHAKAVDDAKAAVHGTKDPDDLLRAAMDRATAAKKNPLRLLVPL